MKTCPKDYRSQQRGVVLPVTMVLLVLVTLVTFSAMRSGTVDQRIATAGEVKAMTFQAAESAIAVATALAEQDKETNLPPPDVGATLTPPALADLRFDITQYKSVAVEVTLAYKTCAATGSLRAGAAVFSDTYYDVSPRAVAVGTDLRSELTSGVEVRGAPAKCCRGRLLSQGESCF